MDNKDVSNFALGLIVAAVLFLILRRELGNHAATPEMGFADGDSNRNTPSGGGCGCGGSGGNGSGQVIPIGGQSYNKNSAYGGSSVVSSTAKVVNAAVPKFNFALIGGGGGGASAPAASSGGGGGYSSSGGSSGGGYAVIGGGFANAF